MMIGMKMASMFFVLVFSLSLISACSAVSQISSNVGNQQSMENTLSDNSYQSVDVASSSYSIDQICDAASRVDAFIQNNHRLPNYVLISSNKVTMPQFLRLMTMATTEINVGKKDPVQLKNVNAPANPSENINNGNIIKANYIDMAQRIQNYINANGITPNYVNSPLGKVGYQNTVYTYSKILNFYKSNNRLPNDVTVNKWVWGLDSDFSDAC